MARHDSIPFLNNVNNYLFLLLTQLSRFVYFRVSQPRHMPVRGFAVPVGSPPKEAQMNSQNLYELFSEDPVEFNMKALKAKLAIALVALIREKEWTQVVAAEKLQVTQPRMSNLVRGKLEKFSIDALLQMWVRVGYKLETDFDPLNDKVPLSLTVKRAML